MKITNKILVVKILMVVGIFAAIILISQALFAQSALEVQGQMLNGGVSEKSKDVSIEIEIEIPDYPQVGSVVFEENATIDYAVNGTSMTIEGAGIPDFMEEITDAPAAIQPLTIALEIEDASILVTWSGKNNVTVSNVDMNVSLHTKKVGQIGSSSKPQVVFGLKNVKMKTEEVDLDEGIIVLSFDTEFPEVDNDLFNQFLAGKDIEGTIIIEME